MTNLEISAIENAGRSTMVWSPEDDAHQDRFRDLAAAALPGLAILLVAALVLVQLITL